MHLVVFPLRGITKNGLCKPFGGPQWLFSELSMIYQIIRFNSDISFLNAV